MVLSGPARRINENMEIMWTSMMPKNVEYQTDDEELVKLSLLLKSTLTFVTGLRHKQLSASSELKSVTNQLVCVNEKKKQSELEVKALRKDLSELKCELQTAEERANKFQKDAEAAISKLERLQSKVSKEVEFRLQEMFRNCLQQNKVATVRDMMTQMYPETQFQEPVITPVNNAVREQPLKQTVTNRSFDVGSPEVIQSTPEDCKRGKSNTLAGMEVKPGTSKSWECKLASSTQHSAPSSPDSIIAGTPTPINNTKNTFQRKDNKKRYRIFKNFDRGDEDADSDQDIQIKPIVYAKDTQDVDGSPAPVVRNPLSENVIVPGTLNPASCDLDLEENKEGPLSILEKENKRVSPTVRDNQCSGTVDQPSCGQNPSTPMKILRPRDSSPILGNSGKKSSSRSSTNSGPSEKSKKNPGNPIKNSSQKKNTSFIGGIDAPQRKNSSMCKTISSSQVKISSDSLLRKNISESDTKTSFQKKTTSDGYEGEVSYRKTGDNKFKKSVQPSIKSALSNQSRSRLSLPKKTKKDISKEPMFNGGQRSAKDVSMNITHLSENEQLQLALAQSIQEKSGDSAFEDSDATVFIPPQSPIEQQCTVKEITENVHSVRKSSSPDKAGAEAQDNSLPNFFQPGFASTAVEEFSPNKRKSPTALEFQPGFCSTEITQNSALHELTEYLDENESAPYPLETSYDRLPQKNTSPNYAYKGPAVRKKVDRMNLPGLECTQCGQYFAAAFGDAGPQLKKEIVDRCSRHRGRHPRPSTPRGFWDPELPSTQYIKARQEEPID